MGEIVKGSVLLGSLRIRQDMLIFEGLVGADQTGTGGPNDPREVALARIDQLADGVAANNERDVAAAACASWCGIVVALRGMGSRVCKCRSSCAAYGRVMKSWSVEKR